MYYIYPYTSNEIYHHGILGQKWGVRRYQNEDGSLTDLGKKRLESVQKRAYERSEARYQRTVTRANKGLERVEAKRKEKGDSDALQSKKDSYEFQKDYAKAIKEAESKKISELDIVQYQKTKAKKIIGASLGLAVAGLALPTGIASAAASKTIHGMNMMTGAPATLVIRKFVPAYSILGGAAGAGLGGAAGARVGGNTSNNSTRLSYTERQNVRESTVKKRDEKR